MIDQLYEELAAACPDFSPDGTQGTLLISSPSAMVYYHADGPSTVLWHIRGEKRVWTYPALDERFAMREALEDIFAGVGHEYLPYRQEFDAAAESFVLRPGQFASWPQNAPHRVTNLNSVNVSLSTEHFTRASRSRARVYKANRFLRQTLGLQAPSTRPAGAGALAKTLVHWAAQAAGLDARLPKEHRASLRVDARSPWGASASIRPQRRGIPFMIDVRHYRTFAELQSIRAELTAIHGRSRRQCPFSTVDYLQAFQENDEFHPAGDHSQLWFLVACENGVTLAYVALRRVDERVFGVLAHKLEFLATHDTDRPHVVSAPADEERATCAFYDFLLAHGESWSFLELRQQDTVSQGHGALLTSANHYVRRFESPQNSTIHITWPDAEAYYRSLSKKARSNMARQFRNLVASGHVLYLSSDSPRALPALFDLYLKVEARSWKSQVDGTIARHPSRLAFFRTLLGSDQPMRLCISLLLLDGVPIAGLIDGVMGRSLFALQIAFDELQFKLSPGSDGSLPLASTSHRAEAGLLQPALRFLVLQVAGVGRDGRHANRPTVQEGQPSLLEGAGGSYLRSILGVDPEKAARFSLVKSGTLQHNPFRE